MIKIEIPRTKIFKVNYQKPSFHSHKADFDYINKVAKKYSKYKNFIILANGGSRTSAEAFYRLSKNKKKFKFITTMEPEVLNYTNKYPKESTLIIPISKSGTNVCPIEGLLYFLKKGYKVLPITSSDRGVLKEISDAKKLDYVIHPNIGGRYSGATTCALFPAKLMGLNIEEISKGAKSMYKKCMKIDESNPALKIASYLYKFEKKGYTEVFTPIYSYFYSGFLPLIIQLMHESFGKNKSGLTFYGDQGPEMQHHTNQRFFGGRRNSVGMFIGVKDHSDIKLTVPSELKDIKLRTGTLGDLNNLHLKNALRYEMESNIKEARLLKIPNIVIEIEKADEYNFGEFLGLMQYVAVYSSWLRKVDPFDQPEVEHSKEASFDMIKNV
jgi:glucose-6-phosphate isomerase